MTSTLRRSLALLLLSPLLAGAARTQTGSIVGSVFDLDGGHIPGTTVTVRAAGETRRAVVDANGRFRLDALRAASYQVSAELPGFQSATAHPVVVTSGRDVVCNFALRVGHRSVTTHTLLDAALPQVLHAADVVVHVRIANVVGSGAIEPSQLHLTTEYAAVVHSTLKRSGPTMASPIRFWQVQAGAWDGDGRRYGGAEPAYQPGDEIVGLFAHDRAGRLVELAGGSFMFRIVNGKVLWPRAPSLGIHDGMSVETLIAMLRR